MWRPENPGPLKPLGCLCRSVTTTLTKHQHKLIQRGLVAFRRAHQRQHTPAQDPPQPPLNRPLSCLRCCPSTAAPAEQPQHGGMHRHVKGGACMEPRQLRQAVGAGAAAEAALGVARGQADDAVGVGGGVPGGLQDGWRWGSLSAEEVLC